MQDSMVTMVPAMVMVMVMVSVVVGGPRIQVQRRPTPSQVTMERQVRPFTCKGKAYGHYADPSTACQVFHICFPHESPDGSSRQMLMWSFTCPEKTVFNQKTHTCTDPGEDAPCGEMSDFYFMSDARDEI